MDAAGVTPDRPGDEQYFGEEGTASFDLQQEQEFTEQGDPSIADFYDNDV